MVRTFAFRSAYQLPSMCVGMLHDLIHKAGGPQLVAECKDKVRTKWLDMGEAVLTGAHGIRHLKGTDNRQFGVTTCIVHFGVEYNAKMYHA